MHKVKSRNLCRIKYHPFVATRVSEGWEYNEYYKFCNMSRKSLCGSTKVQGRENVEKLVDPKPPIGST